MPYICPTYIKRFVIAITLKHKVIHKPVNISSLARARRGEGDDVGASGRGQLMWVCKSTVESEPILRISAEVLRCAGKVRIQDRPH